MVYSILFDLNKKKMYKLNVLIIFCCIVSILSCENRTYYSNGQIKSIKEKCSHSILNKVTMFDSSGNVTSIHYEDSNGNLDSIKIYFSNGIKYQTISFKKDTSNACLIIYYENGKIREVFNVNNNQIVGKYKYFDIDSNIVKTENYILINNKSKLNEILVFDSNGVATPDSKYAEIKSKNDTISIEKLFEVKLIILSNSEYLQAYVADFDSNFNLKDSSTLKAFDPNETLYVKPIKKGLNILRIKVNLINEEKTLYFPIYLEKSYYVK